MKPSERSLRAIWVSVAITGGAVGLLLVLALVMPQRHEDYGAMLIAVPLWLAAAGGAVVAFLRSVQLSFLCMHAGSASRAEQLGIGVGLVMGATIFGVVAIAMVPHRR